MTEKDDLQQRAEAVAREKPGQFPENLDALSSEEIRQVVHKIRVDQIELEMQNQELRRAQVELDATRARYLDLYDLAPVGYLSLSEQGLILEVNLASADMLGLERAMLANQPLNRFILPEDQDIYYHHRKELFKTGRPQTCDLRMVRADGAVFWVILKAAPARNFEGAMICRIVMNENNERKVAEETLKEAARNWNRTFDAIQDGVALLDADQHIIHDNPAFQNFLMKSKEEIRGKHCFQVVHATDHPVSGCPFVRMKKSKKRETMELKIGGSIYSVLVDPILDENGNIDGAVHIITDITERKALEDRLRQAQKMESVGRLAGGVAHDFNNMLGVILGFVELTLDKVDAAHPIHNDLLEIREAAKRSAGLTRQLLAFASLQPAAPKLLDLNEILEGMLQMLRRLIGEDINLIWMRGVGLWPVKMDPSQIDQILVNLCVNARDAISGPGNVTIETRAATFDKAFCAEHPEFIPGDYASLSVSDDGCGMDKETLANIFEPFFTTKGLIDGPGLGLSTIYGIVKQNNGFIDVHSEPGVGTTFNIYLPRHPVPTVSATVPASPEPLKHGLETILLVEDEPAVLKVTEMMLAHIGYTVLAVNTPDKAFRIAEAYAGNIALLITDVVMPEMNGKDLAMKLQSRYPRLKRLFMSGYMADIIAPDDVLEEGVHFIQKPFTIKGLAATVREVLEFADF